MTKQKKFLTIEELIINIKNKGINVINEENISSSNVTNMLRLLVRVRNICCYDDILISFVDDKLGIKNTKYHKKFNLDKNSKGDIIQGKKDLFAILISIKLLLDKEKFNILIDNISQLITEYDKQISSLNRNSIIIYYAFTK